jgi:hypothetical protein
LTIRAPCYPTLFNTTSTCLINSCAICVRTGISSHTETRGSSESDGDSDSVTIDECSVIWDDPTPTISPGTELLLALTTISALRIPFDKGCKINRGQLYWSLRMLVLQKDEVDEVFRRVGLYMLEVEGERPTGLLEPFELAMDDNQEIFLPNQARVKTITIL